MSTFLLALILLIFWEISRGGTWIWSMWGAAYFWELKLLASCIRKSWQLMYDQTDVDPAPVNHRASRRAVQSTLKRHLLVTAQIESIDQVIVAGFLLCAHCLHCPSQSWHCLCSAGVWPAELNGKYPLWQVIDLLVSVNNLKCMDMVN